MNILATMFAALVAADTPAKDQSTTPIPVDGPVHDPELHAEPDRDARPEPELRRRSTTIPDGNPDKMTFNIIEDDSAALQPVIDGQDDYDFHPIPVDRLGEVAEQVRGPAEDLHAGEHVLLLHEHPAAAVRQAVKVRQAVNYAIDRDALVRLYGGLAAPTRERASADVSAVQEASPRTRTTSPRRSS